MLDSAPMDLEECLPPELRGPAMRTGVVNPGTSEGQWAFGKALLKESVRHAEAVSR